ncbi:MAG: hypothetical protein ACI4UK_02535 [Floccifex sp.]
MKFLKSLLVLLLICVGCSQKESDQMKFKNEYENLNGTIREKDNQTIRSLSIDQDNPFIYATSKDILEKIENKESFLVYFGFADCPWCRSAIETFISSCKENNISVVYYVDVKDIRDEIDDQLNTTKQGNPDYMKLIEVLDPVLDAYIVNEVDTHEKRIYAPNFIAIQNGNPILKVDGTSSLQENGYQELSEEMIEDMNQQFISLFDALKDTGCSVVEQKC